jgi:hypothetical protein
MTDTRFYLLLGIVLGLGLAACVAVAHSMIHPASESRIGPKSSTRPHSAPCGALRGTPPAPVRTGSGGTYHVGHGQPGDVCEWVVR